MKLAIMQPYFFPYVGYFQLLNNVDKFIFYDDVNYIKQGWINKNNFLIGKKAHPFSVPVAKQSSFKLISETEINHQLYKKWKGKFLRSIEQSYKKAPFFDEVFPVIKDVFKKEYQTISELAIQSTKALCNYLEINTTLAISSQICDNRDLSGKDRVIAICNQENATVYVNPVGGQKLYDKDVFANEGLKLFFLKAKIHEYDQNQLNFVPGLSIVDMIMYNGKRTKNDFLTDFELI